jgi:hypothetical protein
MKKLGCILLIIFLVFNTVKLFSQDTLPNFSVVELAKGKVQISWINTFSNCNQLLVQRSYDSIKFYVTIFAAQSPELIQNGFVDKDVAPGVKAFYRIFYVLEGGNYFFTKPISNLYKKPLLINNNEEPAPVKPVESNTIEPLPINPKLNAIKKNINGKPIVKPEPLPKKYITIYKQNLDTILRKIEVDGYKKFKDSIFQKTKDTLFSFSPDEFIWKPYIPKPIWKASTFIFTSEKGQVTIHLAFIKQHHYAVKFYEEDGKFLFEIKHLKDADLILDKTNFIHSGWFAFELFEDDKLKEKNKFFIGRDF